MRSDTYVLERRDYTDAIALATRRRLFRFGPITAFMIAVFLAGSLFSGESWSDALRPVNVLGFAVAGLFAAWGIRTALPSVLGWVQASRDLRAHPLLTRPASVEVLPAGICLHNEGGHQTLRWTDIVDFAESDRVMLPYLSPRLFVVLPKSALSADQIEKIRAGLSSTSRR